MPGTAPGDRVTSSTSSALDSEQIAALIDAARAAHERAYAPYSQFKVGAAVLAGGRLFSGVNVENASYGLTICAERSAIFSAVSAGERRVHAVAIVTDTDTPTPPCGACRQVLREFGPDLLVISATKAGTHVTHRLSELLPGSFGPENLT